MMGLLEGINVDETEEGRTLRSHFPSANLPRGIVFLNERNSVLCISYFPGPKLLFSYFFALQLACNFLSKLSKVSL